MSATRAAALLLWVSVTVAGVQAGPVQTTAPAKPAADPPGKAILTTKCFQCHQVSMWSSLRQDRRAWESTLYRMVGRGALWTEAEITAMADFLAQTRGSK